VLLSDSGKIRHSTTVAFGEVANQCFFEVAQRKRAGDTMRREALLVVATVFFLSPARAFAFEGTLEGEISRFSAGAETSAPQPRRSSSIHALSSIELVPVEGAEPSADLQALPASEGPTRFLNPAAKKRLGPGQHLSFVGQLPALPSLPTISLEDFVGRVEKYTRISVFQVE
jgi:hypothetical protein